MEWTKVIALIKAGGLGVGTLKAQNIALITKWWWKLINSRDKLWNKVITSIHNLNRKPANYIARKTLTGAWNNVAKSIKCMSKLNIHQNQIFSFVPGTGTPIMFWKDVWCGEVSFQSRFPSLYSLEKKQAMLGE